MLPIVAWHKSPLVAYMLMSPIVALNKFLVVAWTHATGFIVRTKITI